MEVFSYDIHVTGHACIHPPCEMFGNMLFIGEVVSYHRAAMPEIIASFRVLVCCIGKAELLVFSLLSIERTSDMEGPSPGLSCTHKRPT